ncbi:MAG: diguanylate cyclase [Selenomonas ruminantium]|jgi:diguanylate cyclase (GGDEF)-like protein|nr:diguanylate cyclase [Selenomonas ruminantium]
MKALLSLFIVLSVLLGQMAAVLAGSPATETIRLGIVPPDKSVANARALWQYYVGYLDELSKQNDSQYQLVDIASRNSFSALQNGDADMVLSLEYQVFLAKHDGLIYSDRNFGYDMVGLYTRAEEERFTANDLSCLENARVGVLAARSLEACLLRFQQQNQVNLRVQAYADHESLAEALATGAVDMVADTAAQSYEQEKLLLAFARVPMKIVTTAAYQPKLLEMERALQRLDTENPHFAAQLSQKLAENLDFQLVHYTPAERQFIDSLPPLRLVVYGGVRPYIEYDDNWGRASGIYPDLIAAIAENSGVKFEYIHVLTYEDALNLLKSGKADVMLDIFAGSAVQQPFLYTNPVLEIPYTFVGNMPAAPDRDANVTLLLPYADASFMAFMEQKFPHWQIKNSRASVADTLQMVDGHKDELVLVRNSILEIDRPLSLYPHLAIIPDASINIPMSLAISPQQPRMLQTILNKAITQINPETRTSITQKHIIATKPTFSLQHLLAFYPLQTGLLGGFVVLLLVVIAVINRHEVSMRKAKDMLQEKNLMLMATVKELMAAQKSKRIYKEMAQKDALTGVLNKRGIEEAGSEVLASPLTEGNCHALLIIDLDHFKEANDTLGHQRGDMILRQFALSLIHIVRTRDAVGRFGGDEFILVLNDLPAAMAATVAKRINEAAHNLETDKEKSMRLSASIGIALAPLHGRDYQSLLHTADQALYQVKEQGRDGWRVAAS